jgi:DNA-binding NtrC family response regulator
MRILVIDDEEPVRTLIRIALEEGGYEVVEAATADTAVALYDECPADLVITDLFLPEPDAHANILQLTCRHPGVTLIAMSGAASQETAIAVAKLLGARQILQKPFSIKGLLEMVHSQLMA